MEISNLKTREINQNGYHKNILTRDKIGFIFIAPILITPNDCLACDGYVLKIADYKKLFAVIGTKFNSGSEATDEFRIPDYNVSGRFLQPGTNVGSQIAAGLPNISGTLKDTDIFGSPVRTGCFYNYGSGGSAEGGGSSSNRAYTGFQASRSNAIYGNSSTVQPPSQIVHLVIKYK